MNLDNAVKAIMKGTFNWIEQSREKETHLLINFPSLFIHYCKGVLKNTTEFKKYGDLSFAKNRNLIFDIKDGVLQKAEFYTEPITNINVRKINELIKIEIDCYLYESSTNVKLPLISDFCKEEKEELLNLQLLNNFKF